MESITDGAVNAEITIKTASGTVISAIITSQSCQNLNLAVGSPVTALIKASHIVLGVKSNAQTPQPQNKQEHVMTATIKSAIKPLFIAMMVMGATSAHADLTVYAAASMTNAVEDINKLYEKIQQQSKTSFAASSTLAKQIEQGAPADIYISANTSWMDYLAKR